MGLVYDLIVYAILFLIFAVRKETAKKISMLMAVAYSSISCLAYMLSNNIWLLIFNMLAGLLGVTLVFFMERKLQKKRKKKSKTIAGLLSFFYGSFGAHNFYLGRLFWACLYILFFWTLIPLVVSMIEGVVIFILPKEAFEKIYIDRLCIKDLFKKTVLSDENKSHEDAVDKNKKEDYVDDMDIDTSSAEENVEDDKIKYTNIPLYETKKLKSADVEGTIERFTIKIDTESGPIHFLVENGVITSYYLENKRIYKPYEVK